MFPDLASRVAGANLIACALTYLAMFHITLAECERPRDASLVQYMELPDMRLKDTVKNSPTKEHLTDWFSTYKERWKMDISFSLLELNHTLRSLHLSFHNLTLNYRWTNM